MSDSAPVSLRRRLRRRWRYFRYEGHRRRYIYWTLAALAGLAIAWLVITGFLAKRQLAQVQERLEQVRTLVASGQIDKARQYASDIPAMAERAHDLTTGPAWWIAAEVPYLGEPFDVVRDTTTAAAQVGASAVPDLIDVVTALDPAKLRVSGDTLNVAPLQAALPHLEHASGAIDQAIRRIDDAPSSWFGSVDSGAQKFRSVLSVVQGYVDAAARAAKVLPTMLGQNARQTYFIGLQNESELRGTGGLPGAFAIAQTYHGTIKFTRFESDAVLLPPGKNHAIPTGLDFGKDYDSAYGSSEPTATYVDSNVSPHFPYAAQVWAAMWRKVSGQQVDGVLAVDPTALSYFLAATGPTQLADGAVISSANVSSLTQRDAYALFPNNFERKDFLVSVLKASAHKLTSGAGAAFTLLQATSLSSSQHRLLAWSRYPSIEKLIVQSDYAGAIPQSTRPFAGVILNNAAAGKLDYYLTRSVAYSRTGCGSHRDVIVTISLTNNAPASGLPLYVYTRLDHPPPDAKRGDGHALLDYYATDGAQLQSIAVDGNPATAGVEHAFGHPIYRLDVELPRGTTQTITLHLDEPAGTGTPRIWEQPGVTPEAISVYNQKC